MERMRAGPLSEAEREIVGLYRLFGFRKKVVV